MPQSPDRDPDISVSPMAVPDANRQVRFYQLMLGARKTWLIDALSATLATIDMKAVKTELGLLVPEDVQRILASAGQLGQETCKQARYLQRECQYSALIALLSIDENYWALSSCTVLHQ